MVLRLQLERMLSIGAFLAAQVALDQVQAGQRPGQFAAVCADQRRAQHVAGLEVVADLAAEDGVGAMQAVVEQGLVGQEHESLRHPDGHAQRVLPVEHVPVRSELAQLAEQFAIAEQVGGRDRKVAPQQRRLRTGFAPPRIADLGVHAQPWMFRVGDRLAGGIDQTDPGDRERRPGARTRQSHQARQPIGMETVVRIQDRHVTAARHCDAAIDRGMRAGVGLAHEADPRIVVGGDDLGGTVARAVVDDDQLEVDRLRQRAVDRLRDVGLVVVRRQHHADQHGLGGDGWQGTLGHAVGSLVALTGRR